MNDIIVTKLCTKCKQEKPVGEFYLCGGHYSSRCKKCFGEYQKNNPNRKASINKYSESHREQTNHRQRKTYNTDLEKSREYCRIKSKRLRKENPDHYRKYSTEFNIKRYHKNKNNPSYYITKTLRNRFLCAVTKEYKKTSCLTLLGCSIDEFRLYFEKLFTNGMTWNNHGVHGWHIDHIAPCSSFDLTDIEQQKKCFHYTNLQPLWWYDNLSKRDRIIPINSKEVNIY